MNTFFDVFLKITDYFLILSAISLLTFLMSLVFKKRRTFIVAMSIVLIGGCFILYKINYTTFEKLASNQLNDETIVRNISITIHDLSQDIPERKASVTIEDEELIVRILDDFSDLKLKKERDARHFFREYHVSILTTNQKEKYLLTDSFNLNIDQNYLNHYKIINNTNHLKTIESLVDSGEVDWEYYEY